MIEVARLRDIAHRDVGREGGSKKRSRNQFI